MAWLLVMLIYWRDHFAYGKSITLLTSIGIMVAHTSLTLLIPLSSGQRWIRAGTSVAVAVTVAVTAVSLNQDSYDMRWRVALAGSAGVVASCGTLAQLVLARLNRRDHEHGAGREMMTEATLFCPACGKKQTVALGGAECSRCGLFVHVTVEKRYDQ